jgi:hypothetical protein
MYSLSFKHLHFSFKTFQFFFRLRLAWNVLGDESCFIDLPFVDRAPYFMVVRWSYWGIHQSMASHYAGMHVALFGFDEMELLVVMWYLYQLSVDCD